MTPKYLLRYALLCLTLIVFQVPAEASQQNIDRTLAGGLIYDLALTKAIYRTESFEDTYTEQEAYEDIEYYDVEVPYEVEETYTDYETEYDYQEVCNEVPVSEEVCNTEQSCSYEPREECSTTYEERCESVPVRECTQVMEEHCESVPVQSCTQREECREIRGTTRCRPVNDCTTSYENQCRSRPVNECSTNYENQCSSEPVNSCTTTSEYVCHDEYVCETHTSYETQCHTETIETQVPVERTRWVTHYRTETHSRTVTRYRDVERCCVTRYRDVFDHNWDVSAQLIFPEEAYLNDGETEQVRVELTGNEPLAEFNVTTNSNIYKYAIESAQQNAAGVYEIKLKIEPHLNETALSASQFSNLRLINYDEGANLQLSDASFNTRIQTEMQIEITKKISGEVVYSNAVLAEEADLELELPFVIEETTDYSIKIQVLKSGPVVQGQVEFELTGEYLYERLKPEDHGENSVAGLDVKQVDAGLELQFKDQGLHENIDTAYQLKLINKETGITLLEKESTPDDLFDPGQSKMKWLIEKEVLPENAELKIELSVSRKSSWLNEDILFEKSLEHSLNIDLDVFKDKSLIQGFELLRDGQNSKLKFVDKSPLVGAIATTYSIELAKRKSFGRRTFAKGSFQREALSTNENSAIELSLVDQLDITERGLRRYVDRGKSVYLRIIVERKDLRDNSSVFAELTIQHKFED